MKIVVTGKNGYLSNRIANYLMEEGHDVRKISVRGEEFEDISNTDIVIHVAGITNAKQPNDFYMINSEKTRKVFLWAEECGVKRFAYISSMSVYGTQTQKNSNNPITLKTPTDACSDYGKSKLLAEQSIMMQDNNTKWTILRVPSLYDENKQEYFYTYKTLIEKLPIIIASPFVSKRSILCIDNLCHLLAEIARNVNGQYDNKILLPSDEIMPNYNELIEKVMKDLGVKRKIFHIPVFFIRILLKLIPKISMLYFNAYYGDEDCTKIKGKTYKDYKISRDKAEF